ncbi:MAG: hypothetical protein EBX47_06510 [Synechococcaceae bacterium WB8_1B_057]|nr:hypothetical protein [Synechococcaceae bacterium WB6_1A_059]NDG79066.1 hypothetical protein [Synechococcaceae bacterium WB8_1B_057]
MFSLGIEERLEAWYKFRKSLSFSQDPLKETVFFWKNAPFIPFNHKIDRFNKNDWPTPWEIIIENQYDDFTKAIMIAYTLKLSIPYEDDMILIKTLVDKEKRVYNVVEVADNWVLNFCDSNVLRISEIPDSFMVENQVELIVPR